jgi:hypothetical protein
MDPLPLPAWADRPGIALRVRDALAAGSLEAIVRSLYAEGLNEPQVLGGQAPVDL